MPAGYQPHTWRSADGRLDLFARDYPCETASEGPALLLMHGLTRNSADFEMLAAQLAGRYRLIVPDQRGRGLSQDDPEPANYRPDIYAADMFALLDGLAVARAGLIGTSMGGMIALVMGAMQPARVRAIVLNDVGPVLDPAGLARIAGYVGSGESAGFADWDKAAAACAAINASAFPGFTDPDWRAFARRTCRERDDGTVAFAYDPAIARGFDAEGTAAPPDLWALWEGLSDMPVLTLRGAHSDLLSRETLTQMQRRHAGPFTAVEVPGRGHAPLLGEAEAVEAIEAFLAEYLRP